MANNAAVVGVVVVFVAEVEIEIEVTTAVALVVQGAIWLFGPVVVVAVDCSDY